MEYTIFSKKNIINNVLEENGITPEEANLFLNLNLTDSSNIYNDFHKDISYSRIISCFSPVEEYVDIRNIKGLEYKNSSILDSLLTIYRPESIYENLGKFDFNKFNNSLKHSNFQLIEKDGKYYVFGDGNHRSLLMLFQYYVEYIKLLKTNPTTAALQEFHNKMKVKVPVIHLDHDYNLVSFLTDKHEQQSTYSDTEIDFLNTSTNKKFNEKPIITFNKSKNNYNLSYKGLDFNGISSSEIINFTTELDNTNLKNNFFFTSDSCILSNKHFAITNIPKEHVRSLDGSMSQYNFPDFSFNYYLSSDFRTKKFKLVFEGKDFGEKLEPNYDQIELFLNKNKEILNYKRDRNTYCNNEPLFTFFNYLNTAKFDDLTFKEAIDLINVMSQLNTLITRNKQR